MNGVPADLEKVTALALTNYGHYTSMRVDEQRVRGLSLHLDRLTRDCRRVFDPDLELGHPGVDAEPQVLITTRPAAFAPLPALRLQSTQYCREMPDVKHVGLFSSLRHRRIAQRNGFDDVLFTDAGAIIAEAATSNIGFIDGDRIIWPQADCLPGVTMRLINQARDAPVTTAPVTLGQLIDVDAVFATNAAVGVRPISAIDGTQWSDEHPILHILREQYAAIPPELV